MIVLKPPVTHPATKLKVVLLSGLSDPSNCALSGSQRRFLDQLPLPPECKVYANFPYLPTGPDEQASIPIAMASLRNLNQFLGAWRSPYHQSAQAHWAALAMSCERLLVVTISCGLQILNACLTTGIRPASVNVLCLGPVAWRRPAVPHTLVRGSRDYVVNPWFRAVDVTLPGVGHLDYLKDPSVRRLAELQLARLQRQDNKSW